MRSSQRFGKIFLLVLMLQLSKIKVLHCEKATKFEKTPTCSDVYYLLSDVETSGRFFSYFCCLFKKLNSNIKTKRKIAPDFCDLFQKICVFKFHNILMDPLNYNFIMGINNWIKNYLVKMRGV